MVSALDTRRNVETKGNSDVAEATDAIHSVAGKHQTLLEAYECRKL